MKRRDGQFYLIDAFFAAAIVFIGIGFLVSDFVSTPRGEQARIASLDISTLLFDSSIYEINNPVILDTYDRYDDFLSPMQQIHVWAEEGCGEPTTVCDTWSQELVSALVTDLLPAQHGINITLTAGNEFFFERDQALGSPVLLINTRRMLYTLYDDTLYGPELVEVKVWV